jgi:hypothetical protein
MRLSLYSAVFGGWFDLVSEAENSWLESPEKAVDASEPKIGRGHPPLHARFRKGTSGNSKGRPKGSKNLGSTILDAAHRPVTIELNGKMRRVTAIHATALRLAQDAASGNAKATAKFLDWLDKSESRAAARKPVEYPFSDRDLEVLRAVDERMLLCNPVLDGSDQ